MTNTYLSFRKYGYFKTLLRPLAIKAHILYNNFPLWANRSQRKFHAFCVGTMKSGTHSITNIFENYRARHEPEHYFLIDRFLAFANGKINKKTLTRYLKNRDKRLWLELEASYINFFVVDTLTTEFSDAKFILTIRDCYSWLDSTINHHLNRLVTYSWRKWYDFIFSPTKFKHSAEEKILAELGLPSLDSYLSYWAMHNNKVISTVPKDRLLIVKTHEIGKHMDIISKFLDIPIELLDRDRSHMYKAPKKNDILTYIDRDFIEKKINIHCQALIDKFFL